MQEFERRERPADWAEWRARVRHRWSVPFMALEYGFEWMVYGLSNWRFLELLEYVGRFGVLVAVIFYFAESGDRLKQKHYQAWQVINLAEGKGGNGGRIDALEQLNADGVSLVGVNLASAFLVQVQLPKARLARANFDSADARNSNLEEASVADANLRSANFRGAQLVGASFARSVLDDADFTGADLRNANLQGASLENVDLRNADMEGAKWDSVQSVKGANVLGVKNARFVEWAKAHGAVEKEED
ncbi:MAG: pentapeptide repeat-containing protein [Candidatus Acidiferrum sp.]